MHFRSSIQTSAGLLLLTALLDACADDGTETLFVGLETEGPGRVTVLFDDRPVFETDGDAVWDPSEVQAAFGRADAVQNCARQGRPGVCVELPAGEGLRVTLDATPLPQAATTGFERRTEAALRGCQEAAFDTTRLDCRLDGGQELFVEVGFAPVNRFGNLRLGVESATSFVEAAPLGQDPLRADATRPEASGGARRGVDVRFRGQPGDGEVFEAWTGDCRGQPLEFVRALDQDLACTARFAPIDPNRPGLCLTDERVQDRRCVACLLGTTNRPGDDPQGTGPVRSPDQLQAFGRETWVWWLHEVEGPARPSRSGSA